MREDILFSSAWALGRPEPAPRDAAQVAAAAHAPIEAIATIETIEMPTDPVPAPRLPGRHGHPAARIAILIAAAILLALGLYFLSTPPAPTPPRAPRAPLVLRPDIATPAAPLPLPPVEPLEVAEMTPDRARALNAAVPFSPAPNPPARAFTFVGSPAEKERALTCLASAAWYEAGDDRPGQQAVAQVVLNRMRHPAFPKSVCGVVFQGAERRSGCQFTFTCDGSLARIPSAAAWQRARGVATAALAGSVYAKVGTATHYHTDWVVPYWSASLDKIVAVGTHLFFRWKGWWGQPGAFAGRHAGPETLDPRIVHLAAEIGRPALMLTPQPLAADDSTTLGAPAAASLKVPGVSDEALRGNRVRLMDRDAGSFVLELDASAFPGSYAVAALALCGDRPVCQVMGWTSRAKLPRALPVPMATMRSMGFLYRRNRELDREQVYWNCQQMPRDDPAQCLPGTGKAGD